MPTLNWIGKDKVINHHQDVPYRVLERRYAFGTPDSGNMIIHGDNLDALKALLPQYEGRVKCIYIDPPYNTGNEGWVYNDNVNDPKIKKWLGETVGREGEDLSRHDKWLCMMYPRLRLLQRLLSEDGAIFISIDDNEQANLKLICDEIFGGNCFITDLIWRSADSSNNDSKQFSVDYNHTLVYSKNPGWQPLRFARTNENNQHYKNPDNDPRGPWFQSNLQSPNYRANLQYDVVAPNVCLKVPTGGGKTFIAACALKPIFDALPFTKSKAVVWLVPSDAILEQTLGTLSNPQHPYRERINADFAHRVEVYSKNQLQNGQNFNPATVNENLSVFVLSYDSFRTKHKDGRKAYQENGNLGTFAKHYGNPGLLLADTDETALIQVIRFLCPVVIVDESHHATTALSKEMLVNFNPSFVLDLTATPKKDANIISFVDALQLKRENMVKLPVIVYNRPIPGDVLADAITLRNRLEAQAAKEQKQSGRYIRPIALFQAETKGNETTTFDKIKKKLIDSGIPESHIKIKTAEKNELKGIDLLAQDCPVRYIITINALKEGWDCPFAYILAAIANRSSAVDVEQILGRVLRLPYAQKNTADVLNISYAITSSNDFRATLENVVAGLNNAGFSDRDYRIGTGEGEEPASPISVSVLEENEIELEIDTMALRKAIEAQNSPEGEDDTTGEMLKQAALQSAEYDETAAQTDNMQYDSAPQEVRRYMNVYEFNEKHKEYARALKLPQFVISGEMPSLFTDGEPTLLTKEALTEGFALRDKDTMIDFFAVEGEIARIDISDGAAAPKAWKLTGADNQLFREYFNSQPPEKRISQCKSVIIGQLSKMNIVYDKDLEEYINRIIGGLTAGQLEDLQHSPHIYIAKIRRKIESLLEAHRKQTFELWVEQGKIICEPTYRLKGTISPLKATKTLPKTLYTAEEMMNGLEHTVAWELSNLPNIKCWHRNIARTGFCINGYVNAYPDIIAMTESGKILMIEPKGDHLENAESRQKIEIGSVWQSMAGANYRYYMVFREKDLNLKGAVRFDRLMEIVKEL